MKSLINILNEKGGDNNDYFDDGDFTSRLLINHGVEQVDETKHDYDDKDDDDDDNNATLTRFMTVAAAAAN